MENVTNQQNHLINNTPSVPKEEFSRVFMHIKETSNF